MLFFIGAVCVSHQREQGSVLYIMFHVTVSTLRTESIKLCKIKFESLEPCGKQSLWSFYWKNSRGPSYSSVHFPCLKTRFILWLSRGTERFPSAGVASRKLQRRRVHVSKLNSSRSPHSENDGKNILIRFLAEKQCFNVTLRFQRGGVNAGFFSNAVSLWGLSYFLKPDGGRLCLEWLSDPVSKAAHIHFPTQAVIY